MKERVFAIGDIHGCCDALKSLIEDKIRPAKNDKLILIGDYIDRGSQSKEVIDYIIDLRQKGFDIVPLLGNHEAMLLDAWDDEENLYIWIQNGGGDTFRSFGIKSVKQLDLHYVNFFKELILFYVLDDVIFVHAGFNDRSENPFKDKHDMIWSRNEVYTHPMLKDKTIVHGHTPIPYFLCLQRVMERSKVINVDTGCVYSQRMGFGRLTAFELNGYQLFSV